MEVFKDGQLNAEWIKQLDQKDPLASKIRAFYLPGTKVKPEFKCAAIKCKLPVKSAEYLHPASANYEYNPMIFCFTCNRTFHIHCAGLKLDNLSEEAVPWLCTSCRENVLNAHASAFYKSTKYSDSIRSRRKSFLRDTTIEPKGAEFDTDEEFDSSDIEAFKRIERGRAVNVDPASNEEQLRLQNEVMTAKSGERRATEKAIALERQLLELRAREDERQRQMDQMQQQLTALLRSGTLASTDSTAAHSSNVSLNMSSFYSQGAAIPSSESTRRNLNATDMNQSQVPMVQVNDNSNNEADTTLVDVLSRFTTVQEETRNDKRLASIRKAMPKIAEFNGDSMKWLEFEQDVHRYKTECQYDDKEIKLYIRGALKGDAFEAVKDFINLYPLEDIMQILRESFGDPMILVRRKSKDIRVLKIPNYLYREDAVKIRVILQSYFAACTYAKTGHLNSNELAETIYEQFNNEDKARCKELFMRNNPGRQVVVCLKTIYDYLSERLPILDEKPDHKRDKSFKKEDKPRTAQVMSTGSSVSANKGNSKQDFKFELRDRSTAPYMGYEMNRVNALEKKCEICNRATHFTVQCSQFQAMNEDQRLKTVIEKKLCRNCLISTSHRATECNLKISCGMKYGNNGRCTQKHHATIHYACNKSQGGNDGRQFRRTNTRRNASNAQHHLENAAANNNAAQASQPTGNQQPVLAIQSQVQQPAQRPAQNPQQAHVAQTAASSTSGAFHAQPPRHYNLVPNANSHLAGVVQLNHLTSEVPKTIKMFKNKFIGPKGHIVAYSIGDSAAEVTLVREDLRVELGISGTPHQLSLQWTDGTIKDCMAIKFDLEVQGVLEHSEKLILKDCYSIVDLDLPARSLDMKLMKERFPYLRNINFESYLNEEPVMLIGSPHAFAIESIKGLIEGGQGYPVALEAKLGVTVYGGNPLEALPSSVNLNITAKATGNSYRLCDEIGDSDKVTNEELHDLLTFFNSIESLGIRAKDSIMTEAERNAIAILREELNVLPNGTVEVPLIWDRRDNVIPSLPNNYPVAYKRLLSQESRLSKNPGYYEAYVSKVKELIDLGYMRYANEVDMNQKWNNIWYLPLSLVINANKDPPKFRIVYDASSKYEGVSLNDKLLKGPDLLIDLVKPLLRMRMNQIAFTADVQQMFHRIKVCLRDQQCQRILFRENPSQPVKTLILDVMAFGPTCSPFVSQFVKNWNAENWKQKYPEAAQTIISQMYMDDIITSEPSVEIAISRALECIEICKHINWNLISFQSNSLEFLKALPGEHVKQELMPILANEAEGFTTKVLGCNWDTVTDSFVFQLDRNIFIKLVTEFNYHPTKRDQASTIARIYDVLGLIAPFLIRGKILLQRSWKLKINWDDAIPEDIQSDWRNWLAEIENVAKLKIPRRYCSLDSIKKAEKIQLHVFCDAGAEAYGCVAYIVTHFDNRVESNIVMAKAKVTPLRLQTKTEIKEIPRLELLAALLAARLGDTIIKVMDDIQFDRHYWSDSEVVLRWILNPNQRLLKYAVSPIEEILELTNRDNWHYVPTNLNPADMVTKFKKFDFADSKSEWFLGPEFLKDSVENWPQTPDKLMMDESFMASNIYLERLNYSTHELPPAECTIFTRRLIDKLSPSTRGRWRKLKNAVARKLKLYMDVFMPLVRNSQYNNIAARMELKRQHNGFRHLTSADLERAEHFIFRMMQRETYAEEYEQISQGKPVRNKEFSQLSVFMDRQGLLRINSRANLNSLSFPQQFVPVLPRKNELMPVLLMFYHEKFKHIATESQIAELRSRCWIPQVRQALKTIKAHCNYCKFMNAQPYDQIMAPLPDYRVNPELQPFEVTGIDLLGPLNVISYGRVKKIYIMIFTCTLTRFVHLHILDSLESLRVLEAIVVFWSAHGPVRKFVSDNGTNFVGASKILKEDYENTKIFLAQQQSSLRQKLSEEYSVDWEFIPPGTPWFGGFYERLIKEVKRSIADTLTNRKVTRVELSIAVSEASHRLNLRPLTHNSIDSEDDSLLTPHHLAKHRPGWPLLPGMHNGKYVHVDDRTIYRKGRVLADELMRKFTAYYLPVLTKKVKWLMEKDPLGVGDLVLMIEPNKTRKEWPRGRVEKLFFGKDGQARVADVRKANGKLKRRPIRKLAKINIAELPKTL